MSSSPPPSPSPAEPDAALWAALQTIRQRGPIGERSLADAIAHADRFVRAIPAVARRSVDLGSGGGLPGLVIAVRRPTLALTLVERRRSRADLLRRAVAALGAGTHVEVVADDVAMLARRSPAAFDVVTARSFAAPMVTARWAGELLTPGGLLLVSEPPDALADRWPADLLDHCGLVDLGVVDGIRRLRRR